MGAGRRHGGLGPSRKGVGSIEVPDAGLALAAQKGNGDTGWLRGGTWESYHCLTASF